MRLVRNADSSQEAIKIACEHVLSQFGDITFGPIFCAKAGDGILQILEKWEIVEVYLKGKKVFEVPSLSILEAKPELSN